MNSTVHPGDTVAVVLKGSALIGRLLSIKGSKAVVSFAGQRRDQDLAIRDLTLISAGTSITTQPLPLPEQVQNRLPCTRTAGEAWWLLESDQPGGAARLSLIELSELLLNPVDLAGVAAVWTWLQGKQNWFRWRRDRLVQPLTYDEIRRLRQQRHREQRAIQHEQRQQALLRLDRRLRPSELDELDASRWTLIDHLIQLLRSDAKALRADTQLQHWAPQLGIDLDPPGLRLWLVRLGLLDPDQPLSLRGSVWTHNFSAELEQEAQRLVAMAAQDRPGDEQRTDLTDLPTYSIDDSGTREIDDALSLEQRDGERWVWIHIADPARLVEPDSLLDREARRRATSLYLAEGMIPMLPLVLAAGPLSLRAGQRCAALSLAVHLDQTSGAILNTEIKRSWVKPRYALTYDDGDELIELAPPGDTALAELSALMQLRMRWRRNNGALMFDRAEGRFRRTDGTLSVQLIEPTASRLLVSEAMLLMGAVVADFGKQHGLALPYRSQPQAELPPQAELERIPEGPARDAAIKRCLSRGVQGTQPMPHFSLGVSAYVQATSPIRRYADLLTHRQVLALLAKDQPLDEARIGELVQDLEDPLRQSIQISREDQRHWQQVWFSEHQHTTWAAEFLRWLRPQDQLALIHVADLAMDLVAQVDNADPQPGDRLQLRVNSVDPERGELQLQLC